MVEKCVNNIELVVQVCLRVMVGNFHGFRKDPPSGGFFVFQGEVGDRQVGAKSFCAICSVGEMQSK